MGVLLIEAAGGLFAVAVEVVGWGLLWGLLDLLSGILSVTGISMFTQHMYSNDHVIIFVLVS